MRTGIGTSDHNDARLAGSSAARAALAELNGHRPELILVYASVGYDLPELLAAINEVTGDAPLAGATTRRRLQEGVLLDPDPGVSILALAGADYRFGVGAAVGAHGDALNVGRTVAREAREAAGPGESPYESMVVLSDSLIDDQQELLNGIYRVTGFAVPVVGGVASDDRLLGTTYVFCGDRVLADAVVAVWIGSRRPMRVRFGHGWTPTALPVIVTSVEGTLVREIAGRPAVEVFREGFHDRDDYRSSHAFGLIQPDGGFVIRAAYVDRAGQLRTLTPLPPYAAVQVVSSHADDLLDVGADTVAATLADEDADVVLVFSCQARSNILGERRHEEPERLQKAAGVVPTFGFHTFGEFARTSGVAGYHNATIATLAL